MQHTLIALVEDKPGVLNRVASLFRRRNFNIASLNVGRTEKADVSRKTFTKLLKPIQLRLQHIKNIGASFDKERYQIIYFATAMEYYVPPIVMHLLKKLFISVIKKILENSGRR